MLGLGQGLGRRAHNIALPPTFNPADEFASPWFWGDASDATWRTIDTTGTDSYSELLDKTGQGHKVIQTTKALQPEIIVAGKNGLDIARTAGDGRWEFLGTQTWPTMTLTAVVSVAGDVRGILGYGADNYQCSVYESNVHQLSIYGNAWPPAYSDTVTNVLGWNVFTWRLNGVSVDFWQNGVSIGAGKTWGGASYVFNRIGEFWGTAYAIDYAEIFLSNASELATTIVDYHDHLMDKWGI
jgi:hypothetical protein